MQIEVVLEVAAHLPEAIGGAVVEIALRRRARRIEAAAHEIGKVDLGRYRNAAIAAAREPHPEIKIGGERRLCDVEPGDLVEAGIRQGTPALSRLQNL
jgi:hypothetical protein